MVTFICVHVTMIIKMKKKANNTTDALVGVLFVPVTDQMVQVACHRSPMCSLAYIELKEV